MLNKIKGFLKRVGRKAVIAGISAVSACAMAVSSFAVDGTEAAGGNMASVINSAGTTLEAEFMAMVNSLVPVLIAIAMVGLGMYAIVYLFKMAKKMFGKAAG